VHMSCAWHMWRVWSSVTVASSASARRSTNLSSELTMVRIDTDLPQWW
jgi:hypothetical protein